MSIYWRSVGLAALLVSASCNQSERKNQQLDPEFDMNADRGAWMLPIPARLQWENGHGYCGETSIQSIGLYYGAWISQQVIRQVAGGETLLGVNAGSTLQTLHFDTEEWKGGQDVAHFKPFMIWLKTHLAKSQPVVFATYLDDHDDPDYDHIVPVVGVRPHDPNPEVFDPRDTVVFNSNFEPTPVRIDFGMLAGNREDCRVGRWLNGCVPTEIDYGIAVKGIADADSATLPVRMLVDAWDEPNVSLGHPKRRMQAKALVSGLKAGDSYALLRFNDFKKVPTTGGAKQFLAASYDKRVDFVAQGGEWDYVDPEQFDSDGVLYYRAVLVRAGQTQAQTQ